MARKRQREVALVAIAAVIVAVAVSRFRSAPSVPAEASLAQSSGPPAVRQQHSKQTTQMTEVDLAALNATRPEPVGGTRNPFRFTPTPPPPAPPPVRPVAPLSTDLTLLSGPPPPPRIALKFIGVIESQKTGRVAVLSDTRGVYQGREGDILEGRYRIVRIGVESVDLAYVDGRGRQTIRLTGQ
jgi:hypothetical protein